MSKNRFGVEPRQTPPKVETTQKVTENMQEYSFPEYGITLLATNQKEAFEKLKNMIGEKNIK